MPLANDIDEVFGGVQLDYDVPFLDELSVEFDDLVEVYFDFWVIFVQAVPYALFIVPHREDEFVLGEAHDLVHHVLRAQLPRVRVNLLVKSNQLDVFLSQGLVRGMVPVVK